MANRSPLLGQPTKVRFWANVALPDLNGCMLWLQSRATAGYGLFRLKDINVRAHRFSLTMAEGPAPKAGMDAAHSCRNRHCVAPAHLRWATRSENVADTLRDGTMVHGEAVVTAKLTERQVQEIRQRLEQKDHPSQHVLAREYGVAQSQISLVANGKSWKHIGGDSSAR